jgi:S-formylglutathione hydrolase FrmB
MARQAGWRRRASLLALALIAALIASSASARAANPLRLTARTRLDPRLEQLTFHTPAVQGATDVRLLLPAGYNAHPGRRYPVLYLLHGAVDNYTSWTAKGAAERLTAGYPLIVVMPDGGPTGDYTNWYNGGAGGPPEWETYHIDELLPWIDRHLRTLGTRAQRAVAGLSMGGLGAMGYAARHPDLFAAAASFSGAVDTNNALDQVVTIPAIYGPRRAQEVRARAHNPWDLAQNLEGVNLTIRTGDGQMGGPFGGGDGVEYAVHAMSVSFHRRLMRLGIPSLWDDYGPGGHDWPYWQRDLRETLPTLMSVFAHPKPPPASFTFTAAEPSYRVYGWSAALRRPVLEFSTLRVRAAREFSLTGAGRASVTTPALYRPRSLWRVRVRDAAGTQLRVLRVDRSGRLTAALDLGQTNRYQQYTRQAAAAQHRSVTADVRVEGLR